MRRAPLGVVAAALVLSAAASGEAYVPSGAKWKKLPVAYKINQSTIPQAIQSTAVASVDAGFSSWSAPMCTNFKATNQGNTTATFNGNDGQNTILWRTSSWPAQLGDVDNTIGITVSVFSGDSMIDGDIIFNDVGFNWNTTGQGNNVDTQSIATHEEGHFLGLDHTPILSAVMYASYSGGLKRTLQSDDTNGVCAVYPCSGTGCGNTGAGGAGGSTGTGGAAGSGGSTTTSGCNPVTNAGCAAGEACDFNDQGGYECYPPPNTKKICETCSQAAGFCAGGLTCAGICLKLCCDDGDCGTGQCDKDLLGNGGLVGVCVKQAGQGQSAQPACDAPPTPPSNGACVGGTPGTGGSSQGTGGSSTGTGGTTTGTGGTTPGAGGASASAGAGPAGPGGAPASTGGQGGLDAGAAGASAAAEDDTPAAKGGCGCAVPEGSTDTWLSLAFVGVAMAGLRRRSRPRRDA